MEENPPITLEDVSEKLKDDFDIDYTPKEEEIKPVEAKIIDEPVQAKAEVVETKPVEESKPEPKAETKVPEKSECEQFLDYMKGRYGSTDFLDVVKAYRKGIDTVLNSLGITTWEELKNRVENEGFVFNPENAYKEAKALEYRYNELCK